MDSLTAEKEGIADAKPSALEASLKTCDLLGSNNQNSRNEDDTETTRTDFGESSLRWMDVENALQPNPSDQAKKAKEDPVSWEQVETALPAGLEANSNSERPPRPPSTFQQVSEAFQAKGGGDAAGLVQTSTTTTRNSSRPRPGPPPPSPGAFHVRPTGVTSSLADVSIQLEAPPAWMPTQTAAIDASLVFEHNTSTNSDPSDNIPELEEVVDGVVMSSSREHIIAKSKLRNAACLVLIVAVFMAILLGVILPGPTANDPGTPVTSEKPQPSHYPPFDDQLEPETQNLIQTDPSSPQYRANEWMWNDPFLQTHPRWRRLQRFAMVTKYYATQGHRWFHNDAWLSYNVTECDWWFRTGPACDPGGRLVHEDLSSNNLNGTIPVEASIVSLRHTDMSHNHLHGTLPPVAMENLEVAIHSYNHFVGGLSATAGFLPTNLRIFKIDSNQLEGNTIGFMLVVLPNLEVVNISSNHFGGSLQAALMKTLPKMTFLGAADNRLTGFIPTELGLSTNLRELDLSGNAGITGTVPSELARMPALVHLDISGTSVSGVLPPELCAVSDNMTVLANCSQVQCC